MCFWLHTIKETRILIGVNYCNIICAHPVICEGWYVLTQLYVRVVMCSPSYMWGLAFYSILYVLTQLYARAGILLICGKHLNDLISKILMNVWTQKTSLNPPLSIEMPVSKAESEQLCIYMRYGYRICFYFCELFFIRCWNCSDRFFILLCNIQVIIIKKCTQ